MMGWLVMLLPMTLLGALGGYFFKRASAHGFSFSLSFLFNLGVGGVFYLGSSVLNILTLKHLPYTLVFSLTSITYIWTLLIAYFFLKESLTLAKLVGVSFIIGGAALLVT